MIAVGATTVGAVMLRTGAAREVIAEILRNVKMAVAAKFVDSPRRTPAALVSWGVAVDHTLGQDDSFLDAPEVPSAPSISLMNEGNPEFDIVNDVLSPTMSQLTSHPIPVSCLLPKMSPI